METSHGSTRTPNADADESSSFSYFKKTVTLHDWWLIKADEDVDGKRLAVAGLTSKENRAFRVFSSAPIVKRYDDFTLVTADGIVVVLKWFINKPRTLENGFPDEVPALFLFGFPPQWEEYAKKCFEQAVHSDTDLPNTVELKESMVEPDVTVPMKSSTVSISSPEATLRNLDESITCEGSLLPSITCEDSLPRSITGEDSLPRSITGEDCNILNQSVVHSKETLEFSTGHLGVEVDVIAPSTSERDNMMVSPNNARDGDGHEPSVNVNDIQRPVIAPSTSERDNVMVSPNSARDGNGHEPSRDVNDIQRPKPLSRCSMTQEGLISEASECLDEGSLKRKSKSHVNTPKKVVSDISGAMLRASKRLIHSSSKSKSGKKSEHTVPKERVSSSKQARRKITFDVHATPIRESKNTKCIHTPESLSLKRSRSGRLLLPTLDFWRNQIPVYDADRNVTGVQEELAEVQPSRGSKSQTSRKRKR